MDQFTSIQMFKSLSLDMVEMLDKTEKLIKWCLVKMKTWKLTEPECNNVN